MRCSTGGVKSLLVIADTPDDNRFPLLTGSVQDPNKQGANLSILTLETCKLPYASR